MGWGVPRCPHPCPCSGRKGNMPVCLWVSAAADLAHCWRGILLSNVRSLCNKLDELQLFSFVLVGVYIPPQANMQEDKPGLPCYCPWFNKGNPNHELPKYLILKYRKTSFNCLGFYLFQSLNSTCPYLGQASNFGSQSAVPIMPSHTL